MAFIIYSHLMEVFQYTNTHEKNFAKHFLEIRNIVLFASKCQKQAESLATPLVKPNLFTLWTIMFYSTCSLDLTGTWRFSVNHGNYSFGSTHAPNPLTLASQLRCLCYLFFEGSSYLWHSPGKLAWTSLISDLHQRST